MRILAINVGSSSVKCSFFEAFGEADSPDRVTERWSAQGSVDSPDALRSALPRILDPLWKTSGPPSELDAVAHRIVHGGIAHRDTTWLTPEVRSAIAEQAEFAPSHNRLELAAIEAMDRLLGDRSGRQIAVFDTAFHATIEPAAYVYPGPYEWIEKGIRRFGFHGISHAHAARRAAELLGCPLEELRLITCHLGNGCSLAAVHGGKSVDTTMGFTPADGLMMGSRCGSIDPGIPVYLLRHSGAGLRPADSGADDLDRVFNRESGLKGISGLSGDMREILEAISAGNARAKLAFDMYAHHLCREVGAMLAVLGGLDAIVFTGGVGENCAPLRERVCAQLGFLGSLQVLVIKAEEEQQMARECCRLMNRTGTI
jgi:acetate kinase